MNDSKNIAMAILGIVAVLAVVGLVLMFNQAGSTGQLVSARYTAGYGGQPYHPAVGDAGKLGTFGDKFLAYCMENPETRDCYTLLAKMAAEEGSESSERVVGSGAYYD